MKNKIAFLLFVFFGLVSNNVQAQTTLYVKQKTGLQTTFMLEEVQKITFKPGFAEIVKTNGVGLNYLLTDLKYLSFKDYVSAVTTGIKDADLISSYLIYPNPVKDILYTNYFNVERIDILNVTGQVVLGLNSDSKNAIDVSNLSQGIYICCITQNGQQFFNRFIKE